MPKHYALLALAILILFVLGCSGNGASPVTAPVQERVSEEAGGHQLWGVWQFNADPAQRRPSI